MNLVSIVIPSYGRPDLLERLLRSIKAQSFRGFEVIVIDDNSPQQEAYGRCIENFSRDLNIYIYRNDKNRGAQYSRNRGLSLAKYKYIAFVDDDDEWLPKKLEMQVGLLESSPKELGFVYSWADSVDQSDNIVFKYRSIYNGDNLGVLLDSCFIPSPTVIVKREVFDKVGGFDENMISCQDWDMWTRIVEFGFFYDVIKEVLALNHKHDKKSIGNSSNSFMGYYQYYEKHYTYYRNLGMNKNLSEKYRGIAYALMNVKEKRLARNSLIKSLAMWKLNWKSLIRLCQTVLLI